MYSLIKLLFVLLFISGLLITFLNNLFVANLHTLLGFFFFAFFILYIMQHIKKYKDNFSWQSKKKQSIWSGGIYLLIFAINIFSGLMLFFYALDFVPTWSSTHFYSSFAVFFASLLHLFTRKNK